MAFETTTVPCKSLPAAAAATNITLSATPWANSAFVQVSAGLTPAIQLVSCNFPNPAGGATGDEVEVDIAKGGAGSEVVIGTVRFCKSSSAQYTPNNQIKPILDNIAGSTRISVRARHRDASTGTVSIGFNYYEKPTGIAQVTANALKWWPALATNGIDLNTASPLNSQGQATGAWVELVSSVAANAALTGFYAQPTSAPVNTPHWIEFGTGTLGNEVVVARFKIRPRTNAGYGTFFSLPAPLAIFTAGTRISMRLKVRSITSTNLRCAAQYVETPI